MNSSSETSSNAVGIWPRAAVHSALWRALSPVRRIWMAAERGIVRATAFRDATERDRRVEDVVRASWLFHTADRLLDELTRAWQHSLAVDRGRSLLNDFMSRPFAERLRAGAAIALTASLTALALRLLSRPERLSWLVPAAAACNALVVMLGARAFAAAWERRR